MYVLVCMYGPYVCMYVCMYVWRHIEIQWESKERRACSTLARRGHDFTNPVFCGEAWAGTARHPLLRLLHVGGKRNTCDICWGQWKVPFARYCRLAGGEQALPCQHFVCNLSGAKAG